MSSFRIAKAASQDLQGIFDYLAEQNVAAAKNVASRLIETCTLLAERPAIGTLRPELAESVRTFSPGKPASNYVILYRAISSRIEIIRVLHGARDIPAALQ